METIPDSLHGERQPKLPGQPLEQAPIEIDGRFYDPFNPPKQYYGKEGQMLFKGGEEITRDEAYSKMFWRHKGHVKGLREAMIDSLKSSISEGIIGVFVGVEERDYKTELIQESREKLSAYRVLAKELGYEIGPYTFHKDSGSVVAKMTKTNESAQ